MSDGNIKVKKKMTILIHIHTDIYKYADVFSRYIYVSKRAAFLQVSCLTGQGQLSLINVNLAP